MYSYPSMSHEGHVLTFLCFLLQAVVQLTTSSNEQSKARISVLVLLRPKHSVDDMNPDVRVAVIIKRSNRRDKVLVPREPRFRRYYTDPNPE